MSDLFGVNSQLGGVFKGTSFQIAIGGTGSEDLQGVLVQNLQLQYQRMITRQWEIGSVNQYYIEGRTEGSASLQRIIGPRGLIDPILNALSDICTASGRTMTLTGTANGCGFAGQSAAASASSSFALSAPVQTSFSLGTNAQSFIIDSGMQVMFTALSN